MSNCLSKGVVGDLGTYGPTATNIFFIFFKVLPRIQTFDHTPCQKSSNELHYYLLKPNQRYNMCP